MINESEIEIEQPIREEYIENRFKICILSLFLIASLRFVYLDILWSISDLISAFVIYYTFKSKSSLLAIFCLFNCAIGLIYSIAKAVNDYKLFFISKGFKFYLLIFVTFLAHFVYFYSAVISYKALKIYKKDYDINQNQKTPPPANYGALHSEIKRNEK